MTWRLSGQSAELQSTRLRLTIDLARPQSGLSAIVVETTPWPYLFPMQLCLAADSTPSLESVREAYVRGPDLIVDYAERPARDVTPRIVWRDLSSEMGTPAMEWCIGIQTLSLHSHPRIGLRTQAIDLDELRVRGERDWRDAATGPPRPQTDQGLFLFRWHGATLTYVEMVYASDFHGAAIDSEDATTSVTYRLFPESLEKGVIQLGRVRGLWVPRDQDELRAESCFRDFLHTDLPLTA